MKSNKIIINALKVIKEMTKTELNQYSIELIKNSGPSDHELLLELLKEVKSIKIDVYELKSDVAVLKSDVALLKSDVAALKSDVATLKSDVSSINNRLDNIVAKNNLIE